MKVLTVSATDRLGGAGIAAFRLHRALLASSLDAEMLVWRRGASDPSVHGLAGRLSAAGRARRKLAGWRDRRQLNQNPRKPGSAYWSLNLHDYPAAAAINSFNADVVHLHWLGDNTLPIEQLARIHAPIVWTLHDMWAFTGGCHHAGDCRRYQASCGSCPQLLSPGDGDISARVLREKAARWASLPITIVCPSRWLADCAADSAVLQGKRVEVIGNPLDFGIFKPLDPAEARRALNLPQDKKLLLFGEFAGGANPRKGLHYLQGAIKALRPDEGVELALFGADRPPSPQPDLPAHHMGRLQDEVSLALLYSACDAFVLPSLEENLPNTVMEALACGTPCVAFDTGGVGELLRHRRDGWLARYQDETDLLRGIRWTLSQEWSPRDLHERAAATYSQDKISARYIRLYRSIAAIDDAAPDQAG